MHWLLVDMKKTTAVLVLAAAASFFHGCRTGSEDRGAGLRVGTYNIRLMKGDKDTPNAWDERKADLVKEMRRLDMNSRGQAPQ